MKKFFVLSLFTLFLIYTSVFSGDLDMEISFDGKGNKGASIGLLNEAGSDVNYLYYNVYLGLQNDGMFNAAAGISYNFDAGLFFGAVSYNFSLMRTYYSSSTITPDIYDLQTDVISNNAGVAGGLNFWDFFTETGTDIFFNFQTYQKPAENLYFRRNENENTAALNYNFFQPFLKFGFKKEKFPEIAITAAKYFYSVSPDVVLEKTIKTADPFYSAIDSAITFRDWFAGTEIKFEIYDIPVKLTYRRLHYIDAKSEKYPLISNKAGILVSFFDKNGTKYGIAYGFEREKTALTEAFSDVMEISFSLELKI